MLEHLVSEFRDLFSHAREKEIASAMIDDDYDTGYWQGRKDGVRVCLYLLLTAFGDSDGAESVRRQCAATGRREAMPESGAGSSQ